MTPLEQLRAERKRVTDQREILDRRLHELDAGIDEINGDHLSAEWHRLVAARDPGEHAAWVRLMAARGVEGGYLPSMDAFCEAWDQEIAAEVERIRGERREEALRG